MIKKYIAEFLRDRAERHGALIVYDSSQILKEIVVEMADSHLTVLDASDSFIDAQENAVAWWSTTGESGAVDRRLIVYVPMAAPKTHEEACLDPFSGIAAGAARFPANDDDTFQGLCERAKPDHKEKIRALFAAGKPDLDTLEAVGGSNTWPQLQTLLGVESATEILVGLLAPRPEQREKTGSDLAWIEEAKHLLDSQLGFRARTKGKKWDAIADELWRFLLFSEFVYDLPCELPPSLADVPLARAGSETLVNRVCETLRQERTHELYIDRACRIAQELSLEERMRDVEDLGVCDTFAFEERSFLRQYVTQLLAGELGRAAEIMARRKDSVWVRHTGRGILWTVAERARELLVAAEDLERELPVSVRATDDLIRLYASRAYRIDQALREMETAVADSHGEIDGLEELLDKVRSCHLSVSETLQKRFVDVVAREGWPANGHLRATKVFDKAVAPLLEVRGRKVAYLMVDALRFELAVALERQLASSWTCRLQPVCAQLPTITPVGMAALLPKADGGLILKRDGTELVPGLGGKAILSPADRLDYVKAIYGDRVCMMDLDDVVNLAHGTKKKSSVLDGVELLMVKTTDIDEQGEIAVNNVYLFLPKILSRIIAVIGKLKKLGFNHVILAADHGFMLHSGSGPGSTVAKPAGEWLEVKDRCLLGSGSGASDLLSLPKEHVGISGEFENYVVPRTFATFRKRQAYFHEGLSLPEAVIPLLEVDLGIDALSESAQIDVQLRYRGQATGVVSTRCPMIEVAVFGGDIFANEVAFRLEARAKRDGAEQVVGEAASSPLVDPATGLVRIKAGQAAKVPLRFDCDFTGACELRAVDVETGVIFGSPLKLRVEPIA